MHAPYTDQAVDAFQAAEYAAGAALTCLAVGLLPKRWPVRFAFAVGLWLAVLAPVLPTLGSGFGIGVTSTLLHAALGLARVALVATLLLSGRPWLLLPGGLATAAVAFLDGFLRESDFELCALHIALAGLVLGLVAKLPLRRLPVPSRRLEAPFDRIALAQDVGVFLVGMIGAAAVSHYVLFRGTDSSDEWAYTYQAALFAKGRLYGKVPPCFDAFRMYWVFWRDDRMFAQYQPGWPLFLAPFVAIGQAWLGGPASLGMLGVALARLGRFSIASFGTATPAEIRRGGLVAAGLALSCNFLLINGASRYAHVITTALFALTVEAALRVGRVKEMRRAAVLGAWLGFVVGWSGVVRAPDAVLLSCGAGLYLLVAVVRRRMHPVALLTALLVAAAWLLFLFYSARQQVGIWGVLPYQIGSEFHPWVHMSFSVPSAHMWRWSFPLMWGAYEWFPLVPGVGILGFTLAARQGGDSKRVVFSLAVPSFALLTFYAMLEWGRGNDFGYGPRYQAGIVVPMAIGTAMAVHASLLRLPSRVRPHLMHGFVLVAAVGTIVCGAHLYPYDRRILADVMGVENAVRERSLRNAIVVVPNGMSPHGGWDITRNLPIELYEQPVLYANESKMECLRSSFPSRRLYRAESRGNVKLTPIAPPAPAPEGSEP